MLSEAGRELAAFAEHVNVPVYTSFMGKGALPAGHPLHLGIAGCWGEYPAQEAARNADVILAFGCRFSDIHSSSSVPGFTRLPADEAVHVDIDPQEIGRNYPTEPRHRGRYARGAAAAPGTRRAPRREAGALRLARTGRGVHLRVDNFIEQEKASEAVPIDPRRAIKELRAAAAPDTLMITDTGNHDVGGAVLGRARAADGVHARRLRGAWASERTG